MEVFGYFGALLIGLVLGLTGGGGSILTVPLLVYVLEINPVIATAYSLFIVGTTSTFGAVHNYIKGNVELKKGFLFAIPSFTVVYLTRKYIVPVIPDVMLKTSFFILTKEVFLMVVFGIIMLLASVSMLKKRREASVDKKSDSVFKFLLQTVAVGFLIGLVGAGGGFLIIPSLVFFAKLPMRKAVATSLFIIALNSLIGFTGDVQNISIDWPFLLIFTSISVIGIFIGIYLNKFLNDVQLKKGFGYFVLLMAIFILSKELLGL